MPILLAVVVAVGLLLPAASIASPLQADATIAEYFRLEWHTAPGAAGLEIAGHIDNVGNLPVDVDAMAIDLRLARSKVGT